MAEMEEIKTDSADAAEAATEEKKAKKSKKDAEKELLLEIERLNAEINGIMNAEFICADAGTVEQIVPADKKYDVVIIDPPRKGTTPQLIEYIAAQKIERIVYISCGPDTLARDCALFEKVGYTVGDVQPVDMFPLTGHVESVVCLTRRLDN